MKSIILCCGATLTLAWVPVVSVSQERKLSASRNLSDELKAIVKKVQSASQSAVPYNKLTRHARYYARIVLRKYVLDAENRIPKNATLGGKPFVFFTTPDGLYGKSLLQLYLDIGYETEDIIRLALKKEDVVVLLFRYPKEIQHRDQRKGDLPAAWKQSIYIPTWDNAFALFRKLAQEATIEPNRKATYAPVKIFFRSRREQQFALGFPKSGMNRIKSTSYSALQVTGGADWTWRQLLKTKLSLFPHFRGTGKTCNELLDPDLVHPQMGLFEFLGPNRRLNDLPELAIVHLGVLNFQASFKTGIR